MEPFFDVPSDVIVCPTAMLSLLSPQSQNTPLHLAAASGLLSCVEVRTSVHLYIAVGPV